MITEKTVEELAVTCRLRLTEEERARLAEELSALMELAAPLLATGDEVYVSTEDTVGLSELREDCAEAGTSEDTKCLFASVANMTDGYPTVPRTVAE